MEPKRIEAPQPGVYPEIPFREYVSWDAKNASSLKLMLKSPKHYKHALDNPQKDTAEMAFGRAVHSAVFEPDAMLLNYAVWMGGRRASKEWDQFVAANVGKDILTQGEHERCLAVRDAAQKDPVAGKALRLDGFAEVSIVWDHDLLIRCKSRLDWLTENCLYELKTASQIDFRVFQNNAARLGYMFSLAFYIDAVEKATGRRLPECKMIVVETSPPYDVVPYNVPRIALDMGRQDYNYCLEMLLKCQRKQRWPGLAGGSEIEFQLPGWAMVEDE